MSDDVVAELDRWLGVPPIDDYEPIAIETVQRARDKIAELRAQALMRLGHAPRLAEIEAALAAARREGAEEAEAELKAAVIERDRVMRREGAEGMRERAARAVLDKIGPALRYDCESLREMLCVAIRALPLTPEEPP